MPNSKIVGSQNPKLSKIEIWKIWKFPKSQNRNPKFDPDFEKWDPNFMRFFGIFPKFSQKWQGYPVEFQNFSVKIRWFLVLSRLSSNKWPKKSCFLVETHSSLDISVISQIPTPGMPKISRVLPGIPGFPKPKCAYFLDLKKIAVFQTPGTR